MLISPYDTFACRQYKAEQIADSVESAALIHDILMDVGTDIRTLHPDETSVKPFSHPIRIQKGDSTLFVADTRPCTRIDHRTGKFSITSATDYQIALQRLVTQRQWEVNGPDTIFNLGQFQTRIYCQWIGDSIAKRLGLDVEHHLRVKAIAAYFYYCINDITDAEYYSETDTRQIAAVLSRHTTLPVDLFIELISEISVMSTVQDLISAIVKHAGTVRLNTFSVPVLWSILAGTWFGANGRELACVAVEHPPTFAVLLYNGLTNQAMKNAGLSQVVKPYMRHELAVSYKSNFDLMLMDNLA